ncbi:MAG: ABC transporter permease [Deltaproteobacteria bacterium]|nr:ABC transporter permease [Deltaproteobacteria bacterium]MBW2070219.1 ABC transporter permease [Deltaproteobacteria bacterium]
MQAILTEIGRLTYRLLLETGQIAIMLFQAATWLVRPPLKVGLIFKQMEFVGVKSTTVVILTGASTGAVLALQTYYGFTKFNAETMVGAVVTLSMTRELGPVLTGLMVTARVGSAMATELGTMRVTEQIDALEVMAANPIKHLVVPRLVATVLMLPVLTVMCVFIAVAGGYAVGVNLLHINPGLFMSKVYDMVQPIDLFNGLIKSAFFGLILSLVGCYKGFATSGGAEGVGRSATEAVVLSSVLILVSDYFLTALMF